MTCRPVCSAALVLVAALAVPSAADEAEIVAATAERLGDRWTFSVTLRHGDTGWDDYADGWRVVLEDGTSLGERTLLHPHVEEQPFTRSLAGIRVPEGIRRVFVEARTNTGGWGAVRLPLDLP